MDIKGPLIGCIRRKIEDKDGRWCGFVLLGKNNREILVLTSYNVPQETPVGDSTLHAQQTSLYLLDEEVDPNPKKIFILFLIPKWTIETIFFKLELLANIASQISFFFIGKE